MQRAILTARDEPSLPIGYQGRLFAPAARTAHPQHFKRGFVFYYSLQKPSRTFQAAATAAAAAFCSPTFDLRDDLHKPIITGHATVQVVLFHGSLDDGWSFILAGELERENCSELFCLSCCPVTALLAEPCLEKLSRGPVEPRWVRIRAGGTVRCCPWPLGQEAVEGFEFKGTDATPGETGVTHSLCSSGQTLQDMSCCSHRPYKSSPRAAPATVCRHQLICCLLHRFLAS